MILLFAAGIGAVVFAIALPLFNHLKAFNYARRVGARLAGLNIKLRLGAKQNERDRRDSMFTVTGMVAGAVLGLLLAMGIGKPVIVVIGAVVGMAASWGLRYSIDDANKTRILREIVVLYETIEFFTMGESQHFNIRQALRYSTAITPTIRPLVQRCIDSWPGGPIQALEGFAKDVDLPEANILSTVLIHAEISGMKKTQSAIMEGSRSLENVRQMMAELKIAGKPVYYTIYRVIPVAGIAGIIIGSMINHFSIVLKTVFSF